jgi:hypothetical protein
MTSTPRHTAVREVVIIAITFAVAAAAIPLLAAFIGHQSRQAMFWPALTSLYTYFLPYTLLAALGVTTLVSLTRLILRRLKRNPSEL